MKRGQHQIRWQFNCLAHNPLKPVQFNLDNGDFEKNMRIESIDVMFMSVDRVTNNKDIGSDAHFVCLSTTEAGATPINQETVNNRPYANRGCDRENIGWGLMDNHGAQTILDPHNIVVGDLWLNAWSIGAAKDPEDLQQDIFVLITMTQVEQSGNEALLEMVRESNQD